MTFFPDGKTFVQIGSFSIAWYAICIITGAFIAYKLGQYNFKKIGYNKEILSDYFFGLMITGVLGARLWYVIFMWNELYAENPLEIIMFRHGGLAIQGGIFVGLIFSWWYFKKHKIDFMVAADAIMPGVLIAQALGRWGNFFNREAFGGYTDGLFAMRYIKDQVSNISPEVLEHTVTVNGVEYIQVHPTFLYESLWNLCWLIFLILLRKHKRFDGQIGALYIIGYGLGRVWIEGLRTDQLLIGHTGIAVSQVLSAVLIAAGIIVYIWLGRKNTLKKAV